MKLLLGLITCLLLCYASAFGQTKSVTVVPANPFTATTTAPETPALDLKLFNDIAYAPYQAKERTFFSQSDERPQGFGIDHVIKLGIVEVRAEVIARQPGEDHYVVRYGKPTVWFPWRLRPTGQFGVEKVVINHHEFNYRRISFGIAKRF